MKRSRATRRNPACRHCGERIAVYGSPFRRGAFTTFELRPLDPRDRAGANAYPVYLRTAYRPDELAAQLQALTGCSVEEAAQEVKDLPWHRLHRCLVMSRVAGGEA